MLFLKDYDKYIKRINLTNKLSTYKLKYNLKTIRYIFLLVKVLSIHSVKIKYGYLPRMYNLISNSKSKLFFYNYFLSKEKFINKNKIYEMYNSNIKGNLILERNLFYTSLQVYLLNYYNKKIYVNFINNNILDVFKIKFKKMDNIYNT